MGKKTKQRDSKERAETNGAAAAPAPATDVVGAAAESQQRQVVGVNMDRLIHKVPIQLPQAFPPSFSCLSVCTVALCAGSIRIAMSWGCLGHNTGSGMSGSAVAHTPPTNISSLPVPAECL